MLKKKNTIQRDIDDFKSVVSRVFGSIHAGFEYEFRIGMLTRNGFSSGVTKNQFGNLIKELNNKYGAAVMEYSTSYYYDDNMREIMLTDDKSNVHTKILENKRRVKQHDGMVGGYMVKLVQSIEQKMEPLTTKPGGVMFIRTKTRYIYKISNNTEIHLSNVNDFTYEIEIEQKIKIGSEHSIDALDWEALRWILDVLSK